MSDMPDALSSLRGQPIWVAWDNEGGRKVPKSPHGGNARSNDPITWGTYDEAARMAKKNGYSGVGIMLTDGLIGIDLDGAIDGDGNIKPWAQETLDDIGSYAEISPSGDGIHIIAHANLDKVGAIGRADHRVGVEVYNHGRYFTVTGNQIGSSELTDQTEAIIAFMDKRFPGKSAEDMVRDHTRNLAKDQVRRRANQTMTHNASRDGLRWARVPLGRETCEFCIMLASRGFVYRSADSAGEGNHYHRSCHCKVVPGFDGMELEGYNPAAYYDIWQKAESMKSEGFPESQRKAVILAMQDRLIPSSSSVPTEIAETYQRGIDSALKEFKRIGKSPSAYDSTVGTFLKEMGDASGIPISGSYAKNGSGKWVFAVPDGDELWAACHLANVEPSIEFLPADRFICPDVQTKSGYGEIKTPKSAGKTGKRLKHAAEQLDTAGDGTKRVYLSALRVDDVEAMRETARSFLESGALSEISIIHVGGNVEQVKK